MYHLIKYNSCLFFSSVHSSQWFRLSPVAVYCCKWHNILAGTIFPPFPFYLKYYYWISQVPEFCKIFSPSRNMIFLVEFWKILRHVIFVGDGIFVQAYHLTQTHDLFHVSPWRLVLCHRCHPISSPWTGNWIIPQHPLPVPSVYFFAYDLVSMTAMI